MTQAWAVVSCSFSFLKPLQLMQPCNFQKSKCWNLPSHQPQREDQGLPCSMRFGSSAPRRSNTADESKHLQLCFFDAQFTPFSLPSLHLSSWTPQHPQPCGAPRARTWNVPERSQGRPPPWATHPQLKGIDVHQGPATWDMNLPCRAIMPCSSFQQEQPTAAPPESSRGQDVASQCHWRGFQSLHLFQQNVPK